MKTAIIITRIVLGLIYTVFSVVYFLNLIPQPELQGPLKLFTDGMQASVYLMPLVKIVELVCGLAFLSGRFIPLTSLVILPVTINIVLVHTFIAPEGLVIPILLLAGNLFLIYAYRKVYMPILTVKASL